MTLTIMLMTDSHNNITHKSFANLGGDSALVAPKPLPGGPPGAKASEMR